MLSHRLKKFANLFLPAKKTNSATINSESKQAPAQDKIHKTRVVISSRSNNNKPQTAAEETASLLQDWWIN
jgi:hypothetical protein